MQLCNDAFYNTGITTYIWIMSKCKPTHRAGKVQLIDASQMYEKRRKSIGNKRNDITEECRDLIVKVYGDFCEGSFSLGDKTLESKIFENLEFGYNKITVESPMIDDKRKIVKKAGKPVADTAKRDTENVPLSEDIDTYFEREVRPYNPDAWIDRNKTTVGYEIPFTRYFYKYTPMEPSEIIAARITTLESELMASLKALFGKEGA